MGDRLEQQIGVKPGDGIIENDSQSSRYSMLDKSGGEYFYYIENTKEKESPDDHREGAGQ